jgi:hypothetical protein
MFRIKKRSKPEGAVVRIKKRDNVFANRPKPSIQPLVTPFTVLEGLESRSGACLEARFVCAMRIDLAFETIVSSLFAVHIPRLALLSQRSIGMTYP